MKTRLEQLAPLDEDEIAALPTLSWLIDQHLPENGLGVIYGKPKSGKTFIAVSMACAVSTGEPWLGFSIPRPTEVVYIYAEGWRSTHKRVQAWKQHHRIERLSNFYAIIHPVAFTDAKDLNTMVDAIHDRGLRPGLFVVDTLARCFGGKDENSTQDMGAFIESCDSLRNDAFPGSTVLVVHHTGKDEALGARGSSALIGAVDVEWEVCKGASYDHIILKNTAQKERAELPTRGMEKFNVPGTESATVRWAPEINLSGPDAGKEKACLATLRVIDGINVTYGEWMRRSGLNENTFKLHFRQLRQADLIEKIGDCWRVCPHPGHTPGVTIPANS